MAWYWYLVIALAVVLAVVLIGLFGNTTLKKYAYQLVVNAEKLLGSGTGEEKFNLVVKKLSELTKGIVPEGLIKHFANWAVKRMKLLLEENSESTTKHLAEESTTEEASTETEEK